MALVPRGTPKRTASYTDKQSGRMPKQLKAGKQADQPSGVGSKPTPAPAVDGAHRGHDGPPKRVPSALY